MNESTGWAPQEPPQEILPEDIDQETPEELIAIGHRAQHWNLISLYVLIGAAVAMLLTFVLTESVAWRAFFAILLTAAAAFLMGTSMAVMALRTERKRRGIGVPTPAPDSTSESAGRPESE